MSKKELAPSMADAQGQKEKRSEGTEQTKINLFQGISQVSYFNGIDPAPVGMLTGIDILNRIKSNHYAKQIEYVRQAKGNDAEYRNRKKHLPGVTFGCTVKHRSLKDNSNLVSCSGIIVPDLDHLPDPAATREQLKADPNILFAFISPGGDGLKVGLYTDGIQGKEDHYRFFQAVERYFKEAYGVHIDQACKDLNRLCFVSDDPDLFINPDACPFDVQTWTQEHPRPTPPPQTDDVLSWACEKIRTAPQGEMHITRLNYSRLIGGYVAAGRIDEAEALAALEQAVTDSGTRDFNSSMKTIRDGIDHGKSDPIVDHVQQFQDLSDGPQPLPDELLPVDPFDLDMLPDEIKPWVADICDRMQCPADFVAVAVMVCLAQVIGRKAGMRPQARTDWTVIINLWALIVGRPGVLKSPALEAAIILLKRLIAQAIEEHTARLEQYETDKRLAKLRIEAAEKSAKQRLAKDPGADVSGLLNIEFPEKPVLKRYVANDTSPASLGELCRQNKNGLLVFRDELVSLLKSLDREDQAEGRGFYLTGWNGDSSYTFDRIGRGLNLHIPAVCLSVLGGTQPGRLAEYIREAVKCGAADDGLIQRFGLLVWPDVSGSWKDVDRWPDTQAKNQAFDVFTRLNSLNPFTLGAEQDKDPDGNPSGIPYFRYNPAGLELFQEWRSELEALLRSNTLHPALESHFSKYRKLIPALSLIIHLADGHSGPVGEIPTLKALAWSDYLMSHARRAYASVSQPEISVAKAIIRRIRKGDLKQTFRSWDVWRPGWAMLSDREQVSDALELLEAYGWIISEKIQTGGRPATLYHVHRGAL
jgi:hypothetical protein